MSGALREDREGLSGGHLGRGQEQNGSAKALRQSPRWFIRAQEGRSARLDGDGMGQGQTTHGPCCALLASSLPFPDLAPSTMRV